MSYLVFLGFFLLASITTSSGQISVENGDFDASARWSARQVRRVTFYLQPGGTMIPFYIRKRIFTRAFDTWERVTCINFAITSVKRRANIVLQFLPVTGDAQVATATPPPTQVELTFDSGEIWSTTPHRPPQNSLDLYSVALHLIGNAIGLPNLPNNNDNQGTVMNVRLVDRFGATGSAVDEGIRKTRLQDEDIVPAEVKYGPCF